MSIRARKCSHSVFKSSTRYQQRHLWFDRIKNNVAICNGETNPEKLAELRNGNCKKSEQEMAKALETNGRKDYFIWFETRIQMYKTFKFKSKNAISKLNKYPNWQ
jgi:hypothetical protein